MKSIHRASLETTNFYFEGFGETMKEAKEALDKALDIHTKQYGLPEKWHRKMERRNISITLGVPYRDHQPMKGD